MKNIQNIEEITQNYSKIWGKIRKSFKKHELCNVFFAGESNIMLSLKWLAFVSLLVVGLPATVTGNLNLSHLENDGHIPNSDHKVL